MNKLLEQINTNTSVQVTFFTSRDGYVKLMQEIMTQHNTNITTEFRHQINVLYLKVAVSLAGLVGLATAILEILK